MRVYVSGPMTGIPHHNYPAFNKAAHDLRMMGYEVVNPAELDGGDTTKPWDYYIRRDIKILMDCQGVALLDGWENSKGATLESSIAGALGMTVAPLEDWLRGKHG